MFWSSLFLSFVFIQSFCVSSEEKALTDALMTARTAQQLAPLPLSSSLSYVAHLHAKDLAENYDPESDCLLSSWSDQGEWKPCCNLPKYPEGDCMWAKPRELSNYKANAYELIFQLPDSVAREEEIAAFLLASTELQAMLLEEGWGGWKAFGVGKSGKFISLWFGHAPDPAGVAQTCPGESEEQRTVELRDSPDSTAVTTEIITKEGRRHYLISASYATLSDAETALSALSERFPEAKILSSETNHRISLEDFAELSAAKARRRALMSDFSGIWLLTY